MGTRSAKIKMQSAKRRSFLSKRMPNFNFAETFVINGAKS
jgi:hypothetical protein